MEEEHFAALSVADEDDPFKGFKEHLSAASEELRQAFVDLGFALQTMFTDPSNFAALGVPKLIDAVKELTEGILDFLDAILDLVLETAELAVSELKNVLSQGAPAWIPQHAVGVDGKAGGLPQ